MEKVRILFERVIVRLGLRNESWSRIEYFNDGWKVRIELMAQHLKPGDVVMDLGCGQMWLRDYMPLKSIYIPVDYRLRNGDVLLCDFNKGEFPQIRVDVGFVSGCLEYVSDYKWFVRQLKKFCKRVIISYVTLESQPNIQKRKRNAWVNHLNRNQFLSVFIRSGFVLEEERIEAGYNIYSFASA